MQTPQLTFYRRSTTNCVVWLLGKWPTRPPGKPCSPQLWCMKRGCGWGPIRSLSGKIAGISSQLPPRQCAGFSWKEPVDEGPPNTEVETCP